MPGASSRHLTYYLPGGLITASSIGPRRAFGAHRVDQQVSAPSAGPRRALGSHQLDFHLPSVGNVTRRATGSHTLVPGPVSITAPSVGPRRVMGSHAVQPTISLTGNGIPSRRAFGNHTLAPGTGYITAPSVGPRRAFGSASFGLYVTAPSVGPRRAFGSHTVWKPDMAETRRLDRVEAGFEHEHGPLRRFQLVNPTVRGSFVFGPMGRFFDFDLEMNEDGDIQTADGSLAGAIEGTGVFAEIEPVTGYT